MCVMRFEVMLANAKPWQSPYYRNFPLWILPMQLQTSLCQYPHQTYYNIFLKKKVDNLTQIC